MKKNQWMLPTMSKVTLQATQQGSAATRHHDATTYDSNGIWWAGGTSGNSSYANSY
ncbi:hypothetical protein [Cellulosilyticum ruminicola]|uniref:hypothetical protein n=1 Tax=Cellulosilyticum ruminicola TaxID=425254 RepID=UPI0012EEBAD8|nr:hypothetical protein [Cellulosilyticum ruminicola]